ncbi:MAG: Gfo/Idh/MocA family oxidoreductase [Caldilineaceae bacterium]
MEVNRRDFMKATALTAVGALAVSGAVATVRAQGGGTVPAPTPTPTPTQAVTPIATSTPTSPDTPPAPPDEQPPDLEVPQPVERKIGWAVVGLGTLALEEVMPAFRESKLGQPVALVSGHPDKAQQVAAVYGIDPANLYNYENYDSIADNALIEAVYIILPNSLHAEYTIRGLQAGKHVLCEKPMAPTVEECEQMIAAGQETGRKLMIAYRLHYEPLNLKVKELCEQGAYGPIRTISSSNCQITEAPNIRLSRELGGGPVGDIGIYSINTARWMTGEEPVEVTAYAQQTDDPRFREVPTSVSFMLRFPSGILAHCDCSFDASTSRRYRIHCQQGYIDMDPGFSYEGLQLRVKTGEEDQGDVSETQLRIPQLNQFAAEIDHFSECILNDTDPRTPGEEGLADMRVILAVEEAYRNGSPVAL